MDRQPAATVAQHGAQQQMRAVSRWQPWDEAVNRLVFNDPLGDQLPQNLLDVLHQVFSVRSHR